GFEVQVIVDHRVGGCPHRHLRERVGDHWRGARSRGEPRGDVRIRPRGRRVPQVLDGRTVVDRVPTTASVPKKFVTGRAQRMSTLSQLKWRSSPLYVPWANMPTWSKRRVARNTDT